MGEMEPPSTFGQGETLFLTTSRLACIMDDLGYFKMSRVEITIEGRNEAMLTSYKDFVREKGVGGSGLYPLYECFVLENNPSWYSSVHEYMYYEYSYTSREDIKDAVQSVTSLSFDEEE